MKEVIRFMDIVRILEFCSTLYLHNIISSITHLAVCNFWRDKKSYLLILLAALYKKLVTLQSYQLFTERTVTNFLQSAQSALS